MTQEHGLFMIFTGIEAAVLAQVLKFTGYFLKNRKIDWRLLTTTGGMPSSHSAGVVSLATFVGMVCGFDSAVFAVATTFSLVVMYDAAGLRRSAGKMAACLNKLMDDIYAHKTQMASERLKELLGHTPHEVFWGAITGVCVAYLNYRFLLNYAY